MIRSRGSQPSWMACRVIENAPVMIDWLAMIVAIVASTTSGISSADGHRRKKMLSGGRCARRGRWPPGRRS